MVAVYYDCESSNFDMGATAIRKQESVGKYEKNLSPQTKASPKPTAVILLSALRRSFDHIEKTALLGCACSAHSENFMLLEICIDCIESALMAEQGGAHRIEICSSLSSGGTTPSLGLVRHCVERCKIPCMVMIRPHDGGFVYSNDDIRSMLHDIDAVSELGVQGVVLGALTRDGDVDVRTMKRLIRASRPLQITFHR